MSSRPRLKPLILCAVAYLVIGVTTAWLAGGASSNHLRVAWRLTAWLASAVVFGAHINAERSRPDGSPTVTAWHASLAVALGAFGLAAAATVRALSSGTGNMRLHAIALVAWPMLTAVPAFLVALAVATVLGRRKQPV
jgi:hypothetical protein